MAFDLNIKNFQGIRDLTFHVSGFTVLKGPSSCGKSSVRRAIDFLLRNNWDKSFLRNGETTCEVTLETKDLRIERKKSKKDNSYKVTHNGNTVQYDKIGTDVPAEFKVLGITPLQAEDLEVDLNIYRQRDRMFLVQYSAPERTKILNTLFKVEKFETAARLVKKDLYNTRVSVNSLAESIEATKEQIRSYENTLPLLKDLRESCWWSQDGIPAYVESVSQKSKVASELESLRGKVVCLEGVLLDLDRLRTLEEYQEAQSKVRIHEATLRKLGMALSEFKVIEEGLRESSVLEEYRALAQITLDLHHKVAKMSKVIMESSTFVLFLEQKVAADLYVESLAAVSRAGKRVQEVTDRMSGAQALLDILNISQPLSEFLRAMERVSRLRSLLAEVDKLDGILKLHLICSVYMDVSARYDVMTSELYRIEKDLIEEKKNVCPTCGRPWEVLSEHQHV